jgi:hypothetical protein
MVEVINLRIGEAPRKSPYLLIEAGDGEARTILHHQGATVQVPPTQLSTEIDSYKRSAKDTGLERIYVRYPIRPG